MKTHSAGLAKLRHAYRNYGTRTGNRTRHSPLSEFFISFARPAPLYFEVYLYIYTYPTVYRQYNKYRCYQITLQVKHFYTNRSSAKCSLAVINGALASR